MARTGSPSLNACRYAGLTAASAVKDLGSSATCTRMACIVAVGSKSFTGGGRLFACRHCYRLGYAVQRCGPMDQASRPLPELPRTLGADS